MYIFTVRWLFTKNVFSCSFLFQLQINENNRNINSQKKIKIHLFRIIKFESVGTLNFITWKEDHINQEGNTKIQPSSAFQCFSPGVEIRILIQFGTGSQVFLILPVCSVNNDILLIILVAFIILQMSDFLSPCKTAFGIPRNSQP